MSELLDLAARCEAATGPDRELDIAILTHPAFGYRDIFEDGRLFDRGNDGYWSLEGDEKNPSLPSPTASLDAAMALMPEEAFWRVGNDGEGADPSLFLADVLTHYLDDTRAPHKAVAATPALALTAAALRARTALATPEEKK